jgi:plastocyanin
MKRRSYIIVALAVIVIGVALVAFINRNKIVSNLNLPGTAKAQATPEVSITNGGFLPQTIKVKKGTQVRWTNTDSAAHQVASDPYPTHTNLPGFESLAMLKAETYTFTFSQAGTFTYQDNLNPFKFKGTVIVE